MHDPTQSIPLTEVFCVVQIYTQFNALPAKFNAYIYILVTIGTGAILGIVIYGWSVWAYL